MAIFQSEDRARVKRVKAEQAVNLAMQSRWAEAADLNRQIIDTYPKDIEAHNRLGKALMELSRFDEAREAYNHTLRIDATNTIAQKNLQRLEKLMEEAGSVELTTGPVDPSLFIAETGRSTITSLVELAPADVLAKMNAGDSLALEIQDQTVNVRNAASEMLGKLEPKIRQRLIRLIGMGNEYSAIVTAVDENALRIIIRETHRDPSMGTRPSFPTTGDAFRGYVRDSLLRYDLDEDIDEDDEEFEGVEPEADHDADAASDAETEEVSLTDVHDDRHDDEDEQ
jgi:tetratricopeptide (TPR) repeat protein